VIDRYTRPEMGRLWTDEARFGFMLQVEDRCEASGVSGFYGRVMAGGDIFGEVCVSPPVPLPLWVLTKDTQGNPRYEARLTEYAPLR